MSIIHCDLRIICTQLKRDKLTMTIVFKILLYFFILQLRYQNGESGCCSARLLKWNCGCNIFNCNCKWNPDSDYCYYRDIAMSPHNTCQASNEIASSRRRTKPLSKHPDRHQSSNQSTERL